MDANLKESIVWSALAYVAGKRAQRDLLVDASTNKVALEVVGLVNGRSKFSSSLDGVLTVGSESTSASSTAPDIETLLTHVLSQLPDDGSRAKCMQKVIERFEKSGELPTVNDADLKATGAWLKRLRSTKQISKRGSVAFAISKE